METKQVRSEEVKSYFTPEEKRQLEKIAEKQERSVSNYVRFTILNEIKPEVEI